MIDIEWDGFTNRQLREIEKHLDKKLRKLRRKNEILDNIRPKKQEDV